MIPFFLCPFLPPSLHSFFHQPPLILPYLKSFLCPFLRLLRSFFHQPPLIPPSLSSFLSLTKVVHQFSHILHHYHVWHITWTVKQTLKVTPASNEPTRWVTHKELMQSAISTAVKKVLLDA